MADQEGTDPREAHRSIVRRSMEDGSFRQELLRNPKSALEQHLGRQLPENVEVRAVEDTPERVHLVVPSKSLTERYGELSDEDLDVVAGGNVGSYADPFTSAICCTPAC